MFESVKRVLGASLVKIIKDINVNRKTVFETLGIGLAIITALFGDNIYFQVTGKSFFTSANIKFIIITLYILIGIVWIAVFLIIQSTQLVQDIIHSFISFSLSN